MANRMYQNSQFSQLVRKRWHMNQKRKHLIICSIDQNVHRQLSRMISRVIGKLVDVEGISIQAPLPATTTPDTILVSGSFVAPEARKRFPDVPIIIPNRIITGQNLEKVIMLPDGERVLVATSHQEASEGTIRGLITLGIQHVKFFPYWEGMQLDTSNFKIAITPGMPHLVPPSIRQVIDIGARLISIRSFLNLLYSLGMNSHLVEVYAEDYHRRLLSSTWKMAEVIERLELRRLHEQILIDEFEDGVLFVDENGIIKLANRTASRILQREQVDLLNYPYEQALEGLEKLTDLIRDTEDGQRSSSIFMLGEKKFVRSTIPVRKHRKQQAIITLREIETIQKVEADVRRRLASKGFVAKYNFNNVITSSASIKALIKTAKKFAQTGKNILIKGESGTGKELFAQAIHQNSPQSNGPFVAVNFAGLPESLMESELFGYEEGAFTGARRGGKKGMFEQAHGGTIFLDEIGDAPLPLQARLLRVIQENEVMKIGGSEILPVKVRVLSATNNDLDRSLAEGLFRKDLFYRLCTLTIEIPSLRTRREDILLLLQNYLKRTYNIRKDFSRQALQCLINYHWPGNIRELFNCAEYICLSSEGRQQVELSDLPPNFQSDSLTQAKTTLDDNTGHFPNADYLQDNGFSLDIVRCCLEQLPSAPNCGLGRIRLRNAMEASGIPLTEGAMKRMLNCLRDVGLIRIGHTKQGTLITKEGTHFLDQLKGII